MESINISEILKEAAKETLDEFKKNNYIKSGISYFRRVELLLLSYNKLKSAVKQKDEDIEYIKKKWITSKVRFHSNISNWWWKYKFRRKICPTN